MAVYRARVNEILKACVDNDIKPSGHALGVATGIPAGTINAMLNGREPRNRTMATVCERLGRDQLDLFTLDRDGDIATG